MKPLIPPIKASTMALAARGLEKEVAKINKTVAYLRKI